jgi:hypothetical protein
MKLYEDVYIQKKIEQATKTSNQAEHEEYDSLNNKV